MKTRFSEFHSNGKCQKKRKKEDNFRVYHQVRGLYFLNTDFCFPQSHSVSNGTFNVKQFPLHSFHKKKSPKIEVTSPAGLLRSLFLQTSVYLQQSLIAYSRNGDRTDPSISPLQEGIQYIQDAYAINIRHL